MQSWWWSAGTCRVFLGLDRPRSSQRPVLNYGVEHAHNVREAKYDCNRNTNLRILKTICWIISKSSDFLHLFLFQMCSGGRIYSMNFFVRILARHPYASKVQSKHQQLHLNKSVVFNKADGWGEGSKCVRCGFCSDTFHLCLLCTI